MLLTLMQARQRLFCTLAHPKRAYLGPEEESRVCLPDKILEHLPVASSGYDKSVWYIRQGRAQRIYRVRVLVVRSTRGCVQGLRNLPFGHAKGTEKLRARLGSQV